MRTASAAQAPQGSRRKRGLVVVAAAFVLIVSWALPGALRASTSSTGVVYLSPGGDDGTCARGTPSRACRTFNRAYTVARPGDTVSIGGGLYPGTQRIYFDGAKGTGTGVTFKPARGADAVIEGGLNFKGVSSVTVNGNHHLRVREMNASPYNGHRPTHLAITGIRVFVLNNTDYPQPITGANYFSSVDHLTLRDIEIGPTCCNQDGLDIAIEDDGEPVPSNVVLDHIYIHDIAFNCGDLPNRYRADCHSPATDEHVDCLQFFGGVNVVIENSRFFGCSTSNVMTGSAHGGVFTNWTIQNNLFGPLTHPSNGVDLTDGGPGNSPWSGAIRILHNTFGDGPNGPALIFAAGGGAFRPGTTALVAGNAGGLSRLCVPNAINLSVTFQSNMWGRYKCGPQDLVGEPRFMRSSVDSPDLRLRPGSGGVAAVPPALGPPVDAVGALRPRRWNADVGALQREPAQVVLGAAIGAVSLGVQRAPVEQRLGAAPLTGRDGAATATYGRFGGKLVVRYAADRVVGVGTTSRYYSTASGIAVGGAASTLGGWQPCAGGLRHAFARGVAVAVVRGGQIRALWNVRASDAAKTCRLTSR